MSKKKAGLPRAQSQLDCFRGREVSFEARHGRRCAHAPPHTHRPLLPPRHAAAPRAALCRAPSLHSSVTPSSACSPGGRVVCVQRAARSGGGQQRAAVVALRWWHCGGPAGGAGGAARAGGAGGGEPLTLSRAIMADKQHDDDDDDDDWWREW